MCGSRWGRRSVRDVPAPSNWPNQCERIMAYQSFDSRDEGAADRMADFFGPGHVDQTIRQAIHFCWMSLPKDRKNLDELEKQVRRILDRALKDFREDADQFGRPTSPG